MSQQCIDNVSARLPVGGEFQGHNGDCAEYAYMIARAAVSPQYPTTAEELQRLTNKSIGAGEAGPNGEMTDANAVWLCRSEGTPYVQLAYSRNSLFYWLGQGYAVMCGFRNGQALPGNEPNVFGHSVAVLDHDSTGFTLANGDSVNGRAGKLDTGVLSSQLEAAQPTTLTVIQPVATSFVLTINGQPVAATKVSITYG